VGHPARKPRPTGVQVASNDSAMSDATVDGGTPIQAALSQVGPDMAADEAAQTRSEKPAPVIVHGLPDDAVSFTAGDGTPFSAPPRANYQNVYAAGQANWQDPVAALFAIGHYGTYDYQRDDGTIYPAYANASNYAAGVYMAGAGYSYNATIAFATLYADIFSSNAGSASPKAWWTRGWDDATNDTGPFFPAAP
jgi:hypothetical protein